MKRTKRAISDLLFLSLTAVIFLSSSLVQSPHSFNHYTRVFPALPLATYIPTFYLRKDKESLKKKMKRIFLTRDREREQEQEQETISCKIFRFFLSLSLLRASCNLIRGPLGEGEASSQAGRRGSNQHKFDKH